MIIMTISMNNKHCSCRTKMKESPHLCLAAAIGQPQIGSTWKVKAGGFRVYLFGVQFRVGLTKQPSFGFEVWDNRFCDLGCLVAALGLGVFTSGPRQRRVVKDNSCSGNLLEIGGLSTAM